MNVRRIASVSLTWIAAALAPGPMGALAASPATGTRPAGSVAPDASQRPTRAPAVSKQPRLVGSQPGEGGAMVGNSVAMLFADLDSAAGVPAVEVVDVASRAQIANKANLNCRGTGSARRCLLLVTLLSSEEGRRYRVTAAGANVEVRSAPGHPGDRAR